MRILFLTKYTSTGPSSRYRVVQFLPFLERRGIAWDVHSLHDEHYLDARYAGRRATPLYLARRVADRLAILSRSRRYDVVFIQKEMFPHAPDVPEWLLSKARVRTVVDLDDAIHLFYEGASGFRRALREKIPRVLERASLVLAGNRFLQDYARRYTDRVIFFPTVVDTERVAVAPARSGPQPVVGWMGTPETARYLYAMAPVLEDVARRTPFSLFVVGAPAPPLRGVTVRAKAWREDEEVADLQQMDIGVMPLADDAWSRGKCSLKLLQYMSAGVASVASPRGSAPEIVAQGETGFLASTDDEWRERLVELATSPELRRSVAGRARRRVEADYSLAAWGPRFVDALVGVAEGKSPRARTGAGSEAGDGHDRVDLRRADGSPSTIVFLVTEDWYFWSHRLNLARAARDAGAHVVVATRVGALAAAIEREGFELVSLPWRRRSTNPVREVRAFYTVRNLYARLRPDLVHHVAIKPVVYGGVAARWSGQTRHVNAIAGLGYIETSRHARARVLRPVFNSVLRFAWRPKHVHAVVQNPDDAAVLTTLNLLPRERVHTIRGSGVDVARFTPSPEPELDSGGRVVATFVGRLLWSKGVGEIVLASRFLRARGDAVQVRLVGDPDPENPESVPEETLRAWVEEGVVAWEPWTEDVASVWRTSHMALLPSYREGLPKSLLEAAACARAIVASDVPGCREVARHDVNALLVKPRDGRSLADAIERLARDAALRRRLGSAGREIAVREFAESLVVAETLALYRAVMDAGHRR